MAAGQGKARNARLADADWLPAEYATKSAKQIAPGATAQAELRMPVHRVYAALQAACERKWRFQQFRSSVALSAQSG